MNAFVSQSVLQLVVWGTGIVQLILALYIIALNSRHTANRHASALFFLFAINSFALGLLLSAKNIDEGTLPAIILAATSPIAAIVLLLTAISLVKPDWLSGKWRWIWRVFYLLALVPIIASILAFLTPTPYWFTGLPDTYTGGYVPLEAYTPAELAGVRLFYLVGISLFLTLLLVYWSFFDKNASDQEKKLSRLLLIAQIGAMIVQMGLGSFLTQPMPIVLSNSLFFLVYAYATFSQAISERRLQRGRLQPRLTTIVLVITIPLLIFTPAFIYSQTSERIRQDANEHLRQTSLIIASFASDLNTFSSDLSNVQIGETGVVFVVDDENLVVAHTDPTNMSALTDFSLHPAIVVMRNFDRDSLRYRDQDGNIRIAYIQELENGWGVVVEQQEKELFSGLNNLLILTWFVILSGSVLLGTLTGLAIRQAIFPIDSLTKTVTAITQGDLTRVAPIESEDEIGFLAQAFNQMTVQLLDLISSLEQRVSERTKDLENRSNQLEAAAEVGRATSAILDVNELIQTSVQLIQERFDLYYVGLFLVDQAREFAVLRAGTGEAGKAMLDRQHTIRIGEGMIGWSVQNQEPRIASMADEDVVRQATEELPQTRSEAAIPLRARGQVVGAISVQSVRPEAFDESTIAVLQTMADLVSVAIENARLFTETETALKSTQRAYSELSHEEWIKILQKRPDLSFRSDRNGVHPASDVWTPEMRRAWIMGNTVSLENENGDEKVHPIAIPIKVRGNVIGVIQTHKTTQAGNWTEAEKIMLETIIEQIGVALDSARFFEETQIRASNERVIGEISTRMRETLDVETVLQTAARELRSVLDLAEVEIRMGNSPTNED